MLGFLGGVFGYLILLYIVIHIRVAYTSEVDEINELFNQRREIIEYAYLLNQEPVVEMKDHERFRKFRFHKNIDLQSRDKRFKLDIVHEATMLSGKYRDYKSERIRETTKALFKLYTTAYFNHREVVKIYDEFLKQRVNNGHQTLKDYMVFHNSDYPVRDFDKFQLF